MKLVRIADTQIECSVFLFAAVLAWVLLGAWQSVLCYFFVLLLHESAHLYTAKSLGFCVQSVTLHPFGFSARLMGKMQLWDELCIAAAGPLCSLLAGVSCMALENMRVSTSFLKDFGTASMAIGCINLLPIFPLDGGRVLRACLLHYFDAPARLYAIVGFVLSVLLCVIGFLLSIRANPSFFVMGAFLLYASACELRDAKREPAFDIVLHGSRMKNGAFIRMRHIAVDGGVTIREAYAMASGRYYTVWSIVDASMRERGAVDEGALLHALAYMDAQTPISALVDRAE